MKQFKYSYFSQAKEKYKLRCDDEVLVWMKENPEEINFCGASEGIKVPDTMWGLFIGWACAIHDARFAMIAKQYIIDVHSGLSSFVAHELMLIAMRAANKEMYINTLLIIIAESDWKWIVPRILRATWYYFAVMWGGKNALLDIVDKRIAK
jgi:hypothetical protein